MLRVLSIQEYIVMLPRKVTGCGALEAEITPNNFVQKIVLSKDVI